MIARGKLSEDNNKRFQCKETNPSLSTEAIKDQILRLPEEEFCRQNREYWSLNYLVEEIFLRIASLKVLVIHNGKQISIYKYYNQALRLWKFIPIAKPQLEYVINSSDLTVRMLAELKALGPEGSQQVLRLAVLNIFENIVGPRYTHRSIARNLKVGLDR